MNLLIKSQSATGEKPGKHANSEKRAAPGAALESDLEEVAAAWSQLSDAVLAAIKNLVRACQGTS